MEAILKKRTSSHHNKTSSHHNMVFPIFSLDMKANNMRTFKALRKPSLKSQADYMEEVKQLKEKQEQIYNHNQRFHSQIWQEQKKLAKEIQEVRRSQLAQAVANNKRLETERNMQLASKSEIPITQIPDIMRTNVEKGRPLLHGFLKSDYGASSSSQVDSEEPVPLRTAPPSPYFRPPHPPPN
ncbi:hypothetical protein PIB30_073930 [Stylosanthes scabra]|uniref:Uncharacterized protein n=1 Tax=Stylosanthes scabra TaxID=79078 RepID=A0ABU6ZNA3_9FABA|nr:hypothetical protein [Stylosanthes scabra]